MLLNFIRWLFGYVEFKVIGSFPERFINIVTKNGLSIWNTHKKDGALYACMYIKNYKHIRSYCRKSRVRLKITKRCGLPFYIRKYKSRVGVLIGAFAFLLIVFAMSNFIWTINVTGLETISYNKLMETLNKNGLCIGTYKNSVSFQVIGRDTMLEINDIAWMSINVQGSHASVEIKEKAKSPKVDNYHQPANVKAKCDGEIISMEVYAGVSLFKAGSAVVKDQMIVSGVVEDNAGGVTLVRANSKVMAKTTHFADFSLDKLQKTSKFTYSKSRMSYGIFGLKLPCYYNFADESICARRYSTSKLKVYGTTLPLSKSSIDLYKKTLKTQKLDYNKAEKIFKTKSVLYQCFNLSDCTVTDVNIDVSESDDKYLCNLTFRCIEDIAYQQNIDADNITIEKYVAKEDEKTQ